MADSTLGGKVFKAPPEVLKLLYKRWQKAQPMEFTPENGLLDTVQLVGEDVPGLSLRDCDRGTRLVEAFEAFSPGNEHGSMILESPTLCYEVDALPGGLQLGKL